jgi:peptide/nickel transport system permease protein
MLNYISRRLFFMIFVLLGISTLLFFMSHILPANPAQLAAGLGATAEQVERVRELMGLNKPLYTQYLRYMGSLSCGDLGTSMFTHRPVAKDLTEYLPATLELAVVTMFIAALLGIFLGTFSATKRGRLPDFVIRLFVNAGMGMPSFWTALLLQLIFYKFLGILPAMGRMSVFLTPPNHITGSYLLDSVLTANWQVLASCVTHMILPVTALILGRLAVITRMTRVKVLQVLDEDYIQVARAKGVLERVVVYKHALRNGLIPIVTILGLQLSWLLGGTVLVETVFAWPGIGRYAANSILSFDFPAITAVAMASAVVFSVVNLGIDLLYVLLNPRIRYT